MTEYFFKNVYILILTKFHQKRLDKQNGQAQWFVLFPIFALVTKKQIEIKKRKFEKKLLKIWKTFTNISKPQNWKNTMGRLKGCFCKKKRSCPKSLHLEEERSQMVIFRHKFLRFKHSRFIFYSALGASHMCNQIWLRPRPWSPAPMYLS